MNAFKRFGLLVAPSAILSFILFIQVIPEHSALADKIGGWPFILGGIVFGVVAIWQLIIVSKTSN